MVGLESVKLEYSMQIETRCDRANVAFAAEVSVVAAIPCAVDGLNQTFASKAVITLPLGSSPAADKHLKFWASPRHKVLDIAKNSV